MNHFAYPQMFWLLLLPFLLRAVLPAVKGLHGDALRVPFIGDLVKINLKSGGLWGRSTENPNRISLILFGRCWFPRRRVRNGSANRCG